MPRSRKHHNSEPSITDVLFDTLLLAPYWVGPFIALFTFALLRWAIPAAFPTLEDSSSVSRSMLGTVAMFAHKFALLAAGLILLAWITAEFKKWTDRSRLERQTGASSIRDMNWRDFESLLAEAFRRQGFAVEHTGATGPDGGIDIRLSKAGAITLVQCKHWKAYEVGVRIVRELRGVVASENAQSGIIVTSGRFTTAATDFAAKNPIRLIDGRELVPMIGAVQKSGRIATSQPVANARPSVPVSSAPPQPTRATTPTPTQAAADAKCPLCNAPMVQRTAKRGPNPGSQFLACTRFPTCRGTRDLATR